jgi:hypothetical protein
MAAWLRCGPRSCHKIIINKKATTQSDEKNIIKCIKQAAKE